MIPMVRPPEPGERYDPAAEAAFRLEVERAFGQMSGIDISELNGSLPWSRLDLSGSDLADLETRAIGDTTGSLPASRVAPGAFAEGTYAFDDTFPLRLRRDSLSANQREWVLVMSSSGSINPIRFRAVNDGTTSGTDVFSIFRDGNIEMNNLPTTSPGGSGRLWNDGGTVKIT